MGHIQSSLDKDKGLIVVGDMQHQDVSQILKFATIHDLPILADPLSQLRQSQHPNVITTYDLLFRAGLKVEPDFIIRVGKPVVSKVINQWLGRTEAYQILVQNNDQPDAYPVAPHISYEMSANDFFRQIMELEPKKRHNWLSHWQSLEKRARVELQDYVEHASDESAYVARLLETHC